MPAKSCCSWLRPLTGGRDVLVLNLPTGHTQRISTHFCNHMKRHWNTCCSQCEYVFFNMFAYVRAWVLYASTCHVTFYPFGEYVGREECSVKWSGLAPSTPPYPQVPFLQPCKASKAKQRHHCVGASLSKRSGLGGACSLFFIISTWERHLRVLNHLLGINTYVAWAPVNKTDHNRRYTTVLI